MGVLFFGVMLDNEVAKQEEVKQSKSLGVMMHIIKKITSYSNEMTAGRRSEEQMSGRALLRRLRRLVFYAWNIPLCLVLVLSCSLEYCIPRICLAFSRPRWSQLTFVGKKQFSTENTELTSMMIGDFIVTIRIEVIHQRQNKWLGKYLATACER